MSAIKKTEPLEPLSFDSDDVDLIEATVSGLYSKLKIAAAAYVTPRALQLSFRRHLDTTPMAYLRRVRLDHAHAELVKADPGDGTTVSRVAVDWGFSNPGRFAEQHRAAFGESPSGTLRR